MPRKKLTFLDRIERGDYAQDDIKFQKALFRELLIGRHKLRHYIYARAIAVRKQSGYVGTYESAKEIVDRINSEPSVFQSVFTNSALASVMITNTVYS